MQRIFVVQIFPSRDDFAPLKRLCVDGLPIKQKERLMMKRIFAFLLTLILLAGCMSAMADTLPKPIEKIPYDQIPENRDGIYHYLLLCMDQWDGQRWEA